MTITESESVELTPWFCPKCGQYIAMVTADHHLLVGTMLVSVADFIHVTCGARRNWRRSDGALDDLLARLGCDGAVDVEINECYKNN